MRSHFQAASVFTAGLVALLLTGCGDGGPQLASVSGMVTLDNRPLPGVAVEFQPLSGSPSLGVTDDSGRYTVKYTAKKSGAMLGTHRVRITPSEEGVVAQGNTIVKSHVLPARYNRKTELVADVKSGSNKVDFVLKSR